MVIRFYLLHRQYKTLISVNTTIKNTLCFTAAVTTTAVIFFYSITMYFGSNPLSVSRTSRIGIINFFPQGWAFFTRDSREPRVYFFRETRHRHYEMVDQRNLSAETYFGLSRKRRSIGLDVGYLLSAVVNDSTSHSLTVKVPAIKDVPASFASLSDSLYNTVPYSLQKAPGLSQGHYIVVVQILLPWPLIHRQHNYPSTFYVYPITVL